LSRLDQLMMHLLYLSILSLSSVGCDELVDAFACMNKHYLQLYF
jgi:hypothetical protein